MQAPGVETGVFGFGQGVPANTNANRSEPPSTVKPLFCFMVFRTHMDSRRHLPLHLVQERLPSLRLFQR